MASKQEFIRTFWKAVPSAKQKCHVCGAIANWIKPLQMFFDHGFGTEEMASDLFICKQCGDAADVSIKPNF